MGLYESFKCVSGQFVVVQNNRNVGLPNSPYYWYCMNEIGQERKLGVSLSEYPLQKKKKSLMFKMGDLTLKGRARGISESEYLLLARFGAETSHFNLVPLYISYKG